MLFLTVVHHYLLWHYSRAYLELFQLWLNFLWFTIHFFSLPQLATSWFSPWKRITEARGATWDLEALAGYIIINIISRIIGALMRTFVIAIGLVVLTVVICGGALVLLTWIAAPLLIVSMFSVGVGLLFA